MYMFKEVDQPRAEVSPGSLAATEERVEFKNIRVCNTSGDKGLFKRTVTPLG